MGMEEACTIRLLLGGELWNPPRKRESSVPFADWATDTEEEQMRKDDTSQIISGKKKNTPPKNTQGSHTFTPVILFVITRKENLINCKPL